ncbi:glycosyltransferase family 4 protein [Clostridium saccharoperbutylacetonicum]
MRILVIAPTPFFADRGCHTRILGEIRGLQALNHEIRLCTYGLGRDIDGIDIKRTINFPWYKKLTAGPSLTKILLLPCLTITTIKNIIKFKPDIVHAHLHEGALIAKICSIFLKKPKYFFDLQGSLSGEIVQHKFIKKDSFLHRAMCKLEKMINKWFPIITQSDNLYNQLLKMGIENNNVINALDGVDTDNFYPKEPNVELVKRYEININNPRVLFMGLLEEYQGVDLMLEAFKKVYEHNSKVQFIVIGFPNVEKYEEKCVKLGISSATKFLGRVSYEDVPNYLSLSKIAVAPKISLAEGDGKIYNYMAMGMTTIAFDRSISREIMEDSGLYAKYKDVDDMARRIISVIENKKILAEVGEKARKRALEKLSWRKSAEKITEFYNRHM